MKRIDQDDLKDKFPERLKKKKSVKKREKVCFSCKSPTGKEKEENEMKKQEEEGKNQNQENRKKKKNPKKRRKRRVEEYVFLFVCIFLLMFFHTWICSNKVIRFTKRSQRRRTEKIIDSFYWSI